MAQQAPQNFQAQADQAAAAGDWQAAAQLYARSVAQRASELALINSVQEGLSCKLDMQGIYNMVGDKLRDTFNAQVVMISQYDPETRRVFHHYAIERGQHLQIPGWHPVDTSRAEVVRTCKPFLISGDEILRVLNIGAMHLVPGTELPKTWLGVPIVVDNVARGIVSLQNLDKENAFSQTDIDLLMTLANSMSLSLENARLFNETENLLRLLEGEMELARRTQQSILPLRTPRRSGYEIGSLITPARAVGGDFYDFIHLDKNHLSIVIGDVSGKGLPAALFMALTFSLLRAEAERSKDPRRILLNVNRYLLKMNASSMFVTLLFGVLNYKTGLFHYARAGHLPPILLSADGEGIAIGMERGQPLGILEDVSLDMQEVTIPKGGMVLLCSDGLTEVINAEGQEFGVERVRRELFAARGESAKGVCQRLWKAVHAHGDQMQHQDDFVAVVIKRLGMG